MPEPATEKTRKRIGLISLQNSLVDRLFSTDSTHIRGSEDAHLRCIRRDLAELWADLEKEEDDAEA